MVNRDCRVHVQRDLPVQLELPRGGMFSLPYEAVNRQQLTTPDTNHRWLENYIQRVEYLQFDVIFAQRK
jgi:hypothetical protein